MSSAGGTALPAAVPDPSGISFSSIIQLLLEAEDFDRDDRNRLVTQHAAWTLDRVGNRGARQELSITKLVVPTMALGVVDRAIQVWGGAGVSDDTPLAGMYRYNRMLRIGDGADEVHKQVIARMELAKAGQRETAGAGAAA